MMPSLLMTIELGAVGAAHDARPIGVYPITPAHHEHGVLAATQGVEAA